MLLITLFMLLMFPVESGANNLVIEGVSLSDPDAATGTIKVGFDISWDNAWRNSRNYDAVWVFVKYSMDSGSTWQHATFYSSGTDPAGFSTGTGTGIEIVVPSDKKGCFIQRSSVGAGSMNTDNIELMWDWGEDGLSADDTVRVKVFGIELIYVPAGNFYAGDGNGVSESQYAFHEDGVDNTTVQITTSDVSLTSDTNVNDDIDTTPVTVNGSTGVSGNANFPTGYNAFYCMKYEITEGEWTDFFNTLSTAQKTNRDITSSTGKNSDAVVNRNTLSWASGTAATDRPDRACGYLSWPDLCAYADWAALRPMTELEFEKSVRGKAISPASGEYAWGTTTIQAATTISGAETGTEVITNADANSCYNNQTFSGGDAGTGPLRSGIFATSVTTRQLAGAGYYGGMEFSGNLWERCVSIGNASGRSFAGTHGDGTLESASGFEGNATNSDWPGYVAGQGVSAAGGSGFRGSSWVETTMGKMSVSDRSESAITSTARSADTGARCARTAP